MDPRRLQRILRQHVDTDRLLGADAVPMGVARSLEAQPVVEVSSQSGRESSRPALPAAESPRAPAINSPVQFAVARSPLPDPHSTQDKLAVLQTLDESQVKGCTRCGLCEHRMHTVFGEGDVDARVMVIGEGPGQEEDRSGRPFVGPAGQLLDKQIGAMGLRRGDIYITNIVKCRPPGNRTPSPAEAETCSVYLHQQIMTVQPQVIIAVGGPAMKLLLGLKEGITAVRGKWHTYRAIDPPIPVMPTFHPSYLLRSYTTDNRRKVWEDLQKVMAFLEENPR